MHNHNTVSYGACSNHDVRAQLSSHSGAQHGGSIDSDEALEVSGVNAVIGLAAS